LVTENIYYNNTIPGGIVCIICFVETGLRPVSTGKFFKADVPHLESGAHLFSILLSSLSTFPLMFGKGIRFLFFLIKNIIINFKIFTILNLRKVKIER
ncbi:MAG TPA: hypothetical protein PKY56_02565, partial [Candidatus Kapabacteria bacterium]|nr:hypothetical protein [Candidatus Kapabacteria bacterium]